MSRDIFFFTSNRSKLANLKHIGRGFGLNIVGFREKTYRAPYEEPRISDRDILLRMSYESALSSWVKAFGQFDQRVFFLEDTSVKIDALSGEEEVPGVDVKYWMKEMSFDRLDKLLVEKGNYRTASVRSDIVAHIPSKLRDILEVENPYIWVSGTTLGSIVEIERSNVRNIVHPWLDNRSFSGWFVPNGCKEPLSDLNVVTADQYDFRKRAFKELVLKFKGLLDSISSNETKEQLVFPGFEQPPVIAITGYSCAGKTVLAEWLVKSFGFLHIEASDFMRQAFWERHGQNSEIPIGEFALAALLEEPWIASKPIGELISRLDYPAVVVTGFRSPKELDILKAELGFERKLQVVFIDSNSKIRFDRAVQRARDPITTFTFQNRDSQEYAMGLDHIKQMGEVLQIDNNLLALEPYYQRIENVLQQEITLSSEAALEIGEIKVGKLEALILLALFNSSEDALSTAQISKAIEFLYADTKSKNNISRYFNQEFHPFYRAEQSKGRMVYRLSATGRSIATLLEVQAHRL